MNEFKWRQKNGIRLHLWEMSDGHLDGVIAHLRENFPYRTKGNPDIEISPEAWVAAAQSEKMRRKVAADAAAADLTTKGPVQADASAEKLRAYYNRLDEQSRQRQALRRADKFQPKTVTNFREQCDAVDRTMRNVAVLRVPSDPAACAKFFQSAEFLGLPEHERNLIQAIAEIINR